MATRRLFTAAGLLLFFAVAARLLPHAPNMTPITALAFAGSLYLGRMWAIMLPLAALFLSDLLIGFYDWKILSSVYGSFALIGLLSLIATKYRGPIPVGLSVVGASLLFFVVTNGAVWAFSPWYEKTVWGLLYSYELGLPFLRNMLIGDIVYTAALVAVCEIVRRLSAGATWSNKSGTAGQLISTMWSCIYTACCPISRKLRPY